VRQGLRPQNGADAVATKGEPLKATAFSRHLAGKARISDAVEVRDPCAVGTASGSKAWQRSAGIAVAALNGGPKKRRWLRGVPLPDADWGPRSKPGKDRLSSLVIQLIGGPLLGLLIGRLGTDHFKDSMAEA